MKYCTFYIVRHGETDWNVRKLIQGHEDIPLNKRGEYQAKEIAKELQHVHFDSAFSSDLLRAKKTAEIIVMERNIALKTTQILRERYYGYFQGKHVDEYKKEMSQYLSKLKKVSYENRKKIRVRDRETDEKLMSRVITFLRELAIAYRGKTMLIVAHGGIMRTLLVHLGFITYEKLSESNIKNTAYIKLESDGVDFFVKETFGIGKKQ